MTLMLHVAAFGCARQWFSMAMRGWIAGARGETRRIQQNPGSAWGKQIEEAGCEKILLRAHRFCVLQSVTL